MTLISLLILLGLLLTINGQCLNDCSGHGFCQSIDQSGCQTVSANVSSTCVCDAGWLGVDCSVESLMDPLCSDDSHHCTYWRILNDTFYHRTIAITQTPDKPCDSGVQHAVIQSDSQSTPLFAVNDGWAASMFIPVAQADPTDPMAFGRIIKVTVANCFQAQVGEYYASTSTQPDLLVNQTIPRSNITGYSTATTLDVSWQRALTIDPNINDPIDQSIEAHLNTETMSFQSFNVLPNDQSKHFIFPNQTGSFVSLSIARHCKDFEGHDDGEAMTLSSSLDLFAYQTHRNPPPNNRTTCVSQCSNHGQCVDANNQPANETSFYSSCLCNEGYLGVDCSIQSGNAPVCSGQVDKGKACYYWAFDWARGMYHSRLVLTETVTTSVSGWLAIMYGSTDGMTGGLGTRFSIDQHGDPTGNSTWNEINALDFVSTRRGRPTAANNQTLDQSMVLGHSINQTVNGQLVHTFDFSYSRPIVGVDSEHFDFSTFQTASNQSTMVSVAWGLTAEPWSYHTGRAKQTVSLNPFIGCALDCSNQGKCVLQSVSATVKQPVCWCDVGRVGPNCEQKAEYSLDLLGRATFDWSMVDGLMYGRIRSTLPLGSADQYVALLFRSTDGMTDGWSWAFTFPAISQAATQALTHSRFGTRALSNSRLLGQSMSDFASEWYSTKRGKPGVALTSFFTNVSAITQSDKQSIYNDILFIRALVPNNQTAINDQQSPLVLPTLKGEQVLMSYAFGGLSSTPGAFPGAYHEGNKGKMMIDLFTGINQTIETSIIQMYAPMLAWFGFVLIAGLLVRMVDRLIGCSLLTQRRLPSLIARSKDYEQSISQSNNQSNDQNQLIYVSADKPSLNQSILSALDNMTLNVGSTLMNMTVDQLIVVAAYFAALTYYLVVAVNNTAVTSIHISLGHLTAIHSVLVTFPVKRRSPLFRLLGVSFERALVYHRCCARLTLVFCLTHALLVIKNNSWDIIFDQSQTLHGEGALYGSISLLSLVLLCVTGAPVIRTLFFEFFYYLHLPIAITFVSMAMVHSTYVRYYMIAPLSVYFIERLLRKYYTESTDSVTARIIGDAPHRIVEINVAAPINVDVGQYAFLRFKQISLLQWHPFSISQSNNQSVTFHILENKAGSFTNQLVSHIAESVGQPNNQSNKQSSNSMKVGLLQDRYDSDGYSQSVDQSISQSSSRSISQSINLSVDVDGPYGNLTVDLFKPHYRTLILIAGGVGVTPLASVLSNFLSNQSNNRSSLSRTITRVVFVWAARSEAVLVDLLPDLIDQSSNDERVKLLLFNTQSNKQSNDQSNNHSHNQSGKRAVIHAGRPDLHAIFSQTARDHHRSNNQSSKETVDQSHVVVLACGPTALIDNAQSMSNQFGYHFHKEIFQF